MHAQGLVGQVNGYLALGPSKVFMFVGGSSTKLNLSGHFYSFVGCSSVGCLNKKKPTRSASASAHIIPQIAYKINLIINPMRYSGRWDKNLI